jgi:Tfp pilus assembly protein PilF
MNLKQAAGSPVVKALALLVTLNVLWGCAAGQPVARDDRVASATREIGEAYMRQGDYTAALRELTKAQQMNPEDPYVYDALGVCYMVKQRIPDAIANFKKAVALKPSYAPARNNLGTAYLEAQEWDAAIAVFKEITRDVLYATPHFPLSNLGLAYYRKGDYPTALEYYKEALKIKPDFLNAQWGMGRTYLAMNQGTLALRHLEQAVRGNSKIAELHYDLGDAYLLTGKTEQALFSYETVVDLTPQDSDLSKKARQRMSSLR